MKQYEFDQLTAAIASLSPAQRHQLLERLQHPDGIPAIIEHLEHQLQSQLQCPHCHQQRIPFCQD